MQQGNQRIGAASRARIGALCGTAAVLVVASLATAAGEPKAVLPEMKRTVGPVKTGSSVKFTFPIRNTGSAPLKVLSADGGCDCIRTALPGAIAPGQTGQIGVTLVPEPDWTGKVLRSIQVATNDHRQGNLQFVVTADVLGYVAVDPPSPFALSVERGKSYRQEFTLTPREGSGLTLTNATTDDPNVSAVLVRPAPKDATHTYRLRVNVGPVSKPGDFRSTIHLRTNEPHLPVLSVVINGQAKSGAVALPNQVLVPACSLAQAQRQLGHFLVMSRRAPVKVLGVETGSPDLQAQVMPTSRGHVYTIVVRATPSAKAGRIKATLKVRTDDAANPVIQVPLDAILN